MHSSRVQRALRVAWLSLVCSARVAAGGQTLECKNWDHAFTFLGADDGWLGTSALVIGDVSGDGKADIIVGAPFGNGPGGSRSLAGHVDVLFGPFKRGQCWDLADRPADVRIYGALDS